MKLITYEKAFEIVMGSASFLGTEIVDFTKSLNRILAADVKSDMDMPPFDKATVDGFACRRSDLEHELDIIETIPAGVKPRMKISEKQCARIMTGAVMPEGADMIFMVEDALVDEKDMVRYSGSFTKDNISFRGEDIKKGQTILHAGKLITPPDIALLAIAGCISVVVSRMPRIGVISSGDELVEPEKKPGISKIRDSNSYQIMAQVNCAGASGKNYGIVKDDELATFEMVQIAISENDIVLISGGVSMGDFDFVPSVLERAGVKILFSRVNIQPGKPTTFGIYPDTLVFGLPGNPVSSYIQFELLVKPLICKMMGHVFEPSIIPLVMKDDFSRKNAERHLFIPVIIREGFAEIVEYHGSAHISALSVADGLIDLPVGKKTIEKGETVNVRQF
jgi:molybdopterin molybdotransferase